MSISTHTPLLTYLHIYLVLYTYIHMLKSNFISFKYFILTAASRSPPKTRLR